MNRACVKYTETLLANKTPMAFNVWREQRIKESPHFQYWSTTLDFELS